MLIVPKFCQICGSLLTLQTRKKLKGDMPNEIPETLYDMYRCSNGHLKMVRVEDEHKRTN